MLDWDRIYARSPRWLQTWILNAREWRWQRLRFTPEFFELVAEYETRTFAPREEIAQLRDQWLAEFVLHAANTAPYYRELFAQLKLDPRAIRQLADLAALPILYGTEVERHRHRLRSTAVAPREVIHVRSLDTAVGGPTWPITLRGDREQWAVWERFFRWYGVGHDAWRLDFSRQPVVPAERRQPPYWRTVRAGRQIVFSVEHLREETAGEYLDAMRQSGIPWIHGQAAAVARVARYARGHGVELPIRHVTMMGASVRRDEVQAVVAAFGVKPAHHFSSAFGTANLSQCPAGNLHVDEEFAAVEFVPRGDGTHSIVGTNLSNPAFPLLRYETGDMATLDDRPCHCGRPGRVIRDILCNSEYQGSSRDL